MKSFRARVRQEHQNDEHIEGFGLLSLAIAVLSVFPTASALAQTGPLRPDAVPPAIEAPDASGADRQGKIVVFAENWRRLYPFKDRFPAAESTNRQALDLAAVYFSTADLSNRNVDGERLFGLPDMSTFAPSLVRADAGDAPDLYVAQAGSPEELTELRQWLQEHSIQIFAYLPHDAYLLWLSPEQDRALGRTPSLWWKGIYQPAWRVSPKLDYIIEADAEHRIGISALFVPDAFDNAEQARDAVIAAGFEVSDVVQRPRDWKVRAIGPAIRVRQLALLPGSLAIERFVDYQLHNNVARTSSNVTTGRGSSSGPIMDIEDVWTRGIRGEGQIAAASDTGLSTGNLATLHQDYGQQGSPTNPMRVIAGYALGRATWDDPNPNGGHGTHTSGSIVGNGFRSGSTPATNTFPATSYAGSAPKAQFVFQSIMDSGGNLGGIPADLNTLFQTPYNDGARVHSNSWGAPVDGQYTADSQDVDEFVWNNPDMVITFSAGNSGRDGQQWNGLSCAAQTPPIDGVIDGDSTGAPGTAKNCITVGASENYRPTFVYEFPQNDCTSVNGIEQATWGWFNGCNFSINPVFGDLMADDASGMGAFSSRGPTDDSRFKPEIVAPGIAVVSTRTDQTQQYEQWGICPIPAPLQPYYLTQGGTSMSNPLTAGAATLVRQYYEDGWHPEGTATTNGSAVPGDAFSPSAALVKATLLNGAWDMSPGQYGAGGTQEIPPFWDPSTLPNNVQGFGRVDLEAALFPGSGWTHDPAREMEVHDVGPGLTTGQFDDYVISISSSSDPLIATLVWTDPFAATGAGAKLVNDLDLIVTSPGSTVYTPNEVDDTAGTRDGTNNVEQVKVTAPALGNWTIRVSGFSVPGNGQAGTTIQPYALVISGVSTPLCSTPSNPTGLTATATGANTIELSWTGVAADSYRIYRATSSGGPYSQIASGILTTTYNDTSVSGGTTYFYVVRALNNPNCESADSNEATADAVGDCTTAPTFGGLSSVTQTSTGGSCGLRLEWSAGTSQCGGGPVVYNVYRSTTPGFTPNDGNRVASCLTTLSWDDTSVVGGSTYYYEVEAEDNAPGNGGACRTGNTDGNGIEQSGAVAGGTAVLLFEDFDGLTAGSRPAGWLTGTIAAGNSNAWRGARACAGQSSPNVLRYGATTCTGNYPNNADSATIVAALPIPAGSTGVTLDFYHRWRFETNWDGGAVFVANSTNFPTFNYVATAYLSGQNYNNTSLENSLNLFSGASTGYGAGTMQQTTVDLSSFCSDNAANGYSANCAGDTLYVGFFAYSDGSNTDDGWHIDDVEVYRDGSACSAAPSGAVFLTAVATSGQNLLEWLNPAAGGYGSTMIRWSNVDYPADPTDGTLLVSQNDGLGNKGTFNHSGLTNGNTYYYSAFVDNGSAEYSARRVVAARPFDTSAEVKWAYSTGASALAPPGIGSIYGVANDRVLHSMATGAGSGAWPASWTPLAMNGPAQGRPTVVPVSVGAATKVVFMGSQDHRVYAANADTGQQLWASPDLGGLVQGSPVGIFSAFGGSADLILAGTRNSSGSSSLQALEMATGSIAWTFTNSAAQGGDNSAIGLISGTPLVDYAGSRVIFTSRRQGGGSANSLWCLSFTSSAVTLVWARDLGDIDGSPVLVGSTLYVGNLNGEVHAVAFADGSDVWSGPFQTNDGPVKDYVWPRLGSNEILFSTQGLSGTQGTVWSIDPSGAAPALNWSVTSIPDPSVPLAFPLSGGDYAWVGSSDGRLYQHELGAGVPSSTSLVLGPGTATVGSPVLDINSDRAFVGTEDGRVYAVDLPLP